MPRLGATLTIADGWSGSGGLLVRLYALVRGHRPTGGSGALGLDNFADGAPNGEIRAMLLPPLPNRHGRSARLRWWEATDSFPPDPTDLRAEDGRQVWGTLTRSRR